MRRFVVMALTLAVVVASRPAGAEPPRIPIYEGELSFVDGGAQVDDQVPMTFRLHETPEGADDVVWESTFPVEVLDGLFVVELGQVDPLPSDVFDGGLRYLAVVVGQPPEELDPRQPVGGAPYALVAGRAAALAPAAVQQVSRDVGARLAADPEFAGLRTALAGPPRAACWDATGDADGDGSLTAPTCASPPPSTDGPWTPRRARARPEPGPNS